MKKLLILLLAAMFLYLTGCSFYDSYFLKDDKAASFSDKREVDENIETKAESVSNPKPLSGNVVFEVVDENGKVWLDNSCVISVRAGTTDTADIAVYFKLNDKGKAAFYNATSSNIGKTLPVKIDGEIISEPTVAEVIDSDEFILTGSLDIESAIELVEKLTD